MRGLGSSSYLSKGRFSITMGSWLVQVNLRVGWADLGGKELAETSGQKASGRGQKPTAKPENQLKCNLSFTHSSMDTFLSRSLDVDEFSLRVPGSPARRRVGPQEAGIGRVRSGARALGLTH